MTTASSRVHATSYTSAAHPETAAATHPSSGAGLNSGNRNDLDGRNARFGTVCRATSGVEKLEASQNEPPAAIRLRATPTKVVPRSPTEGTSQNPAAIAPSAAPVVFDA